MGWKGTGKYLCGGCKAKGIINPLTESNCSPSVFKRRAGSCRQCMNEESKEWGEKNILKRKEARIKKYRENPEFFIGISKRYLRTIKGRHTVFKSKVKYESILDTDSILNLNFYAELVRDNECHYCLGPLGEVGHGLDCMDNDIGHRCFNVVPCCKSCNQKKMNDTTYEEMMLLAPALREIRRRREAAIRGADSVLDAVAC
jgi:hypothetical protein